jgi:hypothetical protein
MGDDELAGRAAAAGVRDVILKPLLDESLAKMHSLHHPEQARRLERFRAKWIPVRVKKTRQNKKPEPRSDSIGTEMARSVDLP